MNRRPRKPQSPQITFRNANCLAAKKTDLEEFIQRHQLDVVLIGETHLRASNGLTFLNFRVHRTAREGTRGGGTAILIKSTIDDHADLALDLNHIEATAITVNLATGQGKLPGNSYPRRQSQRQASIMELEADERKRHLSTPFCRRLPPPGGRHRRAHDIPAQRTARRPGHSGLCRMSHNYQLSVLNEPSSDHNPVLLQLGQAAKLSAHQLSPGHGHDCRPYNTHQATGANGRPRRYPQPPIRVPQKAQHHSPSAAHRRTDKRRLQPTGVQRSDIP
ncbi:hypothetical protein Trydic_g8100 [Trypoxylus dichotomus]